MRIVSFDAFRTLHIPGVHYVKPESFSRHLDLIREADWVLFPEYWQVHSICYGLNSRIFPSLVSYHLGHNKIEMTRAFQVVCPRHIPDTEILANTPETCRQLWERLDKPFVAKTPDSSEGKGVYRVDNELDWRRYCNAHPVLYVQQYLPIDRDLRLVVIGRRIVAGYWRLQSGNGFHNNLAAGGRLDFSPAPAAAVELVTHVAQTLGIDHAGFDVAMVGGHPYILEFNRLFGNIGLREQNIRPAELIYAYLAEKHSPEFTPPNNHLPPAWPRAS